MTTDGIHLLWDFELRPNSLKPIDAHDSLLGKKFWVSQIGTINIRGEPHPDIWSAYKKNQEKALIERFYQIFLDILDGKFGKPILSEMGGWNILNFDLLVFRQKVLEHKIANIYEFDQAIHNVRSFDMKQWMNCLRGIVWRGTLAESCEMLGIQKLHHLTYEQMLECYRKKDFVTLRVYQKSELVAMKKLYRRIRDSLRTFGEEGLITLMMVK